MSGAMRADFPLPDIDWEPTRAFWAGAARHELLIPRCDGCAAYTWYPRERCRTCRNQSFTWTAMSGRGRLFSWAVVTRAFIPQFEGKVPFVQKGTRRLEAARGDTTIPPA